MSEDMTFSARDAILSNLSRLSREQSIISEQRLLELYDIALPMADTSIALLDDGLECNEMLSVLSDEIADFEYPTSDDTTPELRSIIERNLSRLVLSDRVTLTEIYLKCLSDKGYMITESDFLRGADSDETFTYVRNGFSDEAYDVFSQDFDDPKVRYSSTFKECAQMVSSGDVTYCLLPLEERGGTRLPTVSEIIFRNDFKINSVIPVFGPDGTAHMKYALVSKSFTVPERLEDDDLYLEIRIGVTDDSPLFEVLGAVEHFGMSVYRVNTVVFDTEGDEETYFSVVIKDSGNSFAPLLCYLTLFLRDFVPVGIYKNLE